MQTDQCLKCSHYWGLTHCDAFPDDGIPDDILFGEFDHTAKHPQQKNDIVFEPEKEKQDGKDGN